MPSGESAAQQTQNAQATQQSQAEQYAAKMQAQALAGLAQYLSANPSPASTWGPIKGPTLASPATVGSATVGGARPPATIGGNPLARMLGKRG